MRNKNYKMLQIPAESHDLLKEYCRKNGYKMGRLVEKLIEKECASPPKEKILKVNR